VWTCAPLSRGCEITRRMIGPLVLGVVGVAILLWLGAWQMQRMVWKQAVLAEIAVQVTAAPVSVPAAANARDHRFLTVQAQGRFTGEEIHVLASNRDTGAGYRVIAVLQGAGRRLLVDRGFIPTTAKELERPARDVTVTGNLHWPDEVDGYTPSPDLGAEIWFARDVPALAVALQTEPVMIVASSDTGDGVTAFPVNVASIPNNHLNYAITWFLLAAAWFGMTVFLLLRIKRQTNG